MFKEEPFESNPNIIRLYIEEDMNFVYRDMEVRDSPLLLTCSLTTFDFEDKDRIVQI